ncbi:MAG TPA: F0F1 ATP synthase subunit B [Caulobacteraceae bacterium]|jgi:F-type H+-transporting ATPase subunit b|nr:F0F1 ATP synthase subunit B [Caulobacteraceae bacterium]
MEFFQDAEAWVLVGLLIFIGILIWAKVPGMAMKALDARGEKIQAELNEALRLRQEAQALLATIKTQREDAERVAAEMIANAQADSERMRAEAAVKLEEQIKRRQQMAERKIATAEAQAAAEVRAAAGDLAAQIAEQVLAARLQGLTSDPLIDRAVDQMPGKLQ